MYRFDPGAVPLGKLTLGDTPKGPLTFTDWFAVDDGLVKKLLVDALDEDANPVTAATASNGMAISADARRMTGSRYSLGPSWTAGLSYVTGPPPRPARNALPHIVDAQRRRVHK